MTFRDGPGGEIVNAVVQRVGGKRILTKAHVCSRLEYEIRMRQLRTEIEGAYRGQVKIGFDSNSSSSGTSIDEDGKFHVRIGLLCDADDVDKGQISDYAIMRGLVSLAHEMAHVEQLMKLRSRFCTFEDIRIACQARMVDLFPEYERKRYARSRSENAAELQCYGRAMQLCSGWFPEVDPERYKGLIVDIAHEPPDPNAGRWLFEGKYFDDYDGLRAELKKCADKFDETAAAAVFPEDVTAVAEDNLAGHSVMWQHIWLDKPLLRDFLSCGRAIDQELMILREAISITRSAFFDKDPQNKFHGFDHLPGVLDAVDAYGLDKYGDASVHVGMTGKSNVKSDRARSSGSAETKRGSARVDFTDFDMSVEGMLRRQGSDLLLWTRRRGAPSEKAAGADVSVGSPGKTDPGCPRGPGED